MSQKARADRFDRLVTPHLDAAWRLARWLTRNEADAEDLVQDAFARAWRFLDDLRGEDARPWLMQIVRTQAWSRMRADKARPRAVAFEDAAAEAEMALAGDNEALDAETLLLRQEDRALIHAALADLPAEFREILVLREVEDMAYKDLAQVIGTPIGTVMSRLSRARTMLGHRVRQLSEEAGHGPR